MAEGQTVDARIRTLSTLITVEAEARSAESVRDLAYIVVNDTRQVLPASHAFLFDVKDHLEDSPILIAASGVSAPDRNAPWVRTMERLAKQLWAKCEKKVPEAITLQEQDADVVASLSDGFPPYLLMFPLLKRDGHPFAFVVMAAEEPWDDAYLALAEILAGTYSHAWQSLAVPERARNVIAHLKRKWKWYAIGVLVFLLLPVRQYVLAPAEVIALEPHVVAAPMEGVVDQVMVDPNSVVASGDTLFRMEDTDLSSRLTVALRALDVAKAEYLTNAQEAFQCDDCRGKVPKLRAVMDQEEAKVDWAQQQLARSIVSAPVAGVVVFQSKSDWEGKPVSTGQKVMMIADPKKTRLRILLPVGDAIGVDYGSSVIFYPNVSPLSSYPGSVKSLGYEAQVQPDQTLAFELIAEFDAANAPLGWRGSAKLYGGRAPLAYLFLRKPLAWMRRTLGF